MKNVSKYERGYFLPPVTSNEWMKKEVSRLISTEQVGARIIPYGQVDNETGSAILPLRTI